MSGKVAEKMGDGGVVDDGAEKLGDGKVSSRTEDGEASNRRVSKSQTGEASNSMTSKLEAAEKEREGEGGEGAPKISKAAAKKAEQKARKAAIKAEAKESKAASTSASGSTNTAAKADLPLRSGKGAQDVSGGKQGGEMAVDRDPMDACFDVGWLKDVYQIAPVGVVASASSRDGNNNKGGDADATSEVVEDGIQKANPSPSSHVVTRFPPEPNGYLHIGHAKAIAVNFGFAKHYSGKCYLRYDDTNPEKEEGRYFESIRESVEWLGYEPAEITYSSDRFDELYALAEALVERGKAYVCHCSKEEIQRQKGGKEGKENPRYECSHRNRPSSESLHEFRRMRDGHYAPKTAVLRMKMDLLGNPNPCMWDVAAYRIPDEGHQIHHRTLDKWRIYPTYDFTHCLCDAMERISHSLCTTEFRTARESYDWLVGELKDLLPVVPQQREYGRLNLTSTVLSKRKIQSLVSHHHVSSWSDPRLFTLIALRRRGIPPGAIRAFVADLGVSDATTSIQLVRLESTVRKYLERSLPRVFLVLDPVPVVIENLPKEGYCEMIELEFLKGGDPRVFGTHKVPFTRTVFIDRADFRADGGEDANFFRLAPGKTVGLLNVPWPIVATGFVTDVRDERRVVEVRARILDPNLPGYDQLIRDLGKSSTPKTSTSKSTSTSTTTTQANPTSTPPPKPKSFIQWVAHSPAHHSPIPAKVRIHRPLFRSLNPDTNPQGFLADVNQGSEIVYENAVLEVGFEDVRQRGPWPKDFLAGKTKADGKRNGRGWDTRFQGVRVAYFCVDEDEDEDEVQIGDGDGNDGEGKRAKANDHKKEKANKLVLNQIVPLKEDREKDGGGAGAGPGRAAA